MATTTATTDMHPRPTITKRAAPTGQSCDNCRFSHSWLSPQWSPLVQRRVITECRRFPPVFLPGEDSGADYPSTIPGGWCGEWRGVE